MEDANSVNSERSRPKSFWAFYAVTVLILAGASAVPLWNFLTMVLAYYQIAWFGYDVTAVVPFMAVLTAILIGFLFLPMLWHMSILIKRIIVSVGATGIFLGLELFSEMISASLKATFLVLTSRMMRSPEEIAELASIPWVVRIHYYLFSVILILAVLNFLYNLSNVLFGDGRPGKRVVILHGIATAAMRCLTFLCRLCNMKTTQFCT